MVQGVCFAGDTARPPEAPRNMRPQIGGYLNPPRVKIFRVYKKGSKPSAPWRFNFGIEINLHEFDVFKFKLLAFH